MKSNTRRCGNCRKKISASDALYGNLKAFCDYACLRSYMSSNAGQKAVQKAYSAEHTRQKENLKTRTDYIKEAQAAFNRYVRVRDSDKPCISCGSPPVENVVGGNRDCGHMLSRGAHPQHRYRLDNTASQCVRCNRYLSGNVANFRKGMIERWGLERIERLEGHYTRRTFTIEYLKRVKRIFTKRANRLQKRKNNC